MELVLITYMRENIEYPYNEMAQKGYFWDATFFEESEGNEYLYIVIKSDDFTTIMDNEDNLTATPFRAIYETFREQCWAPEPYTDIESLFCFNSSINFSN